MNETGEVGILCFDGKNAEGRRGALSVSGGSLCFRWEEANPDFPPQTADSWKLVEDLPDGFFRLELNFGSEVIAAEGKSQPLCLWLRRGESPNAASGLLHRRGIRIVLWLCALAATGTFLYLFALPLAVTETTRRLPRSWDTKVGNEILKSLVLKDTATGGGPREALQQCQAFLNQLSPSPDITFRLHWMPDSGVVNAFALPGGEILLYQGLVRQMKGPDELLGVLAHEAGHVVLRHGMRRVVRAGLLGIVSSLSLGDVSGAASVILDNAGAFAQLSYGREEESAADAFSMESLARLNQDCRGMENLFRRGLGVQLPGWIRFVSTHPSDDLRVKALTDLRKKSPGCGDSTRALSREGFQALQNFQKTGS